MVRREQDRVMDSRAARPRSSWLRFVRNRDFTVNELSAIKNGAKTLLDWGEAGFVPVEQSVAQARSDVCAKSFDGNPCPHNQKKLIDFTSPAAAAIKSHIESKNQMKLSVDGEQNLNVCMICRCWLPLKVWTPMETLLACTPEKVLNDFKEKYPPCWMITETKTPATP